MLSASGPTGESELCSRVRSMIMFKFQIKESGASPIKLGVKHILDHITVYLTLILNTKPF